MAKDNAEWREAAGANAARLQHEIDGLLTDVHSRNLNYGQFWKHAKAVSQLFKELKPLIREDRERLWSQFSSGCDNVRAEQDRNRERRENVSGQKRSLVESKISEAYYAAKASDSTSDFANARKLLNEALAWMKDGWEGFNVTTQIFTLNDGRMTKADHDACWRRWTEVNETLKFRRQEIFDFNYGKFKGESYEAAGLADSCPRDAKEKVRTIQADMKGKTMDGWQFDEIRKILDDTYSRATAAQQLRHEEWQRKQVEWRERLGSAKSRKLELLEKNRDVLANLERQIDHCRDMLRDARSSEFEQRVQGWIDEKLDKIRDIERFNRELEEQVREIDNKLAS